MTAVFVRTPQDVENILRQCRDLENAVFFSTSPSARITAEEHGFEVKALHDYLSNDELEGVREQALKDLNELWVDVCRHEEGRGDVIGEAAIRKMVWYPASYELYNFRRTAVALMKVKQEYSPRRTVVATSEEVLLMGVRCDSLAIGLEAEFENVEVVEGTKQSLGLGARVKATLMGLARNCYIMWRTIKSVAGGAAGRILVVSSGRLFGRVLPNWQLVELPVGLPTVFGEVRTLENESTFDREGAGESDWCRRLMVAELIQVWRYLQRIGRRHLWWVDWLVRKCGLVAFGYPPVQPGLASLCVERARHLGVPVVGYQHGPNYGMQWVGPKLYHADYCRCSVFWSWGLSRERMQAVLPDGLECPPVEVLGKISRQAQGDVSSTQREPSWDIVFPVTLVGEWFRESLRIDAETMLQRQIEICEVLDRLARARDLRILVKPIKGLHEIYAPVSRYEKRWPNLVWDRSVLFSELAVAGVTRLVVTEFPSSPLFEALAGSVPVVSMETPFINYTEEVARQMGEAVRWVSDMDGLEKEILLLLDNPEQASRSATDADRFTRSNLKVADPSEVHRVLSRYAMSIPGS